MRVSYGELPEELKRTSTLWGLGMVGRTWAVIAACVWLAREVPAVWAWALAVVGIGVMQYHLSVLGHHTLHGNITRTKGLNDFLARYFVHGPLGLPQDAMWRNHMTHHTKFEQPEDPERDHYALEVHDRTSRRKLVWWWATRFVGAEAFMAAGRVLRGAKGGGRARTPVTMAEQLRDWLPVATVQLALAVALWLATGHFWAYLALWTLPQTTVLTGLMASRTMLEHADAGEPPQRLLSFDTGWLGRLMLGPMCFNWHAEHHLYPTIPAQHLPQLHRVLRERSALTDVRVMPSYTHRFVQLARSLPPG